MKITKYFLSMAAALGMIAGCQKPEMIQIAAPEDVVAPVLEAVEGPIEITPSNMVGEKVTFTWSAADYGVATQVNYSLLAATAAAPETRIAITSGLTATTVDVAYETLNAILFNDLKLNDGVAEDVVFTISAKVGEYSPIYSNAITVSCKVTAAEKQYPKLTVAGSYAYNNWTPGKGQFVYDFEGTDVKYSGVIDFGEDVSALNFKFVGEAWGNNEFSVPAGESQTPEAAELPLVAGGGDNIAAYTTHRFYSLTLDKAAPKVIKNFSFNSLGVIGDATPTGWDADTDMQFNAEKQRFYVDITLIDGKIKFRADDGWDVNWGGADGALSAGGADIAVAAGDYRIYVNLNDPANLTYELNKGMFGKDEPTSGTTTPEEPVTLVGWGLVGAFSGWADGADVMLVSDGTYLVAKGVALDGEFKFRKDGAWGTNFGYAEGAIFEANAEIALAQDGPNLVAVAGTYDVYLDEANAKAWFITDGSYPGGGEAPSTDVTLYFVPDADWSAGGVTFAAWIWATGGSGTWYEMVEANGAYAVTFPKELDNIIFASMNGATDWNNKVKQTADLKVPTDGSNAYDAATGAWYVLGGDAPVAPEQPETPAELTWYLVGNFNGWATGDVNYQMTKESEWYVYKGFTADGQGVKFNAGSWDVNRGGAFVAAGAAIEITQGGADMIVAAGTYDVYMNADASVAYFMTPGESPATPDTAANTWYLVGNFNGWATGDANYKMTYENGWHVFKGFSADGQGVKLNAGSWDNNRGGAFVAAGEAIAVTHNGADMIVAVGTYDVYLNKAEDTLYFMTPGETPAN